MKISLRAKYRKKYQECNATTYIYYEVSKTKDKFPVFIHALTQKIQMFFPFTNNFKYTNSRKILFFIFLMERIKTRKKLKKHSLKMFFV